MSLKSTTRVTQLTLILLSTSLLGCGSWGEQKDDNRADIYLQLGIRYLSMNRLEVAKENLEKSLQEEPNNAQAHNVLAHLYEKIEKIPEAKAHYESALNIAPNDLGVQNNYGHFLCEQKQFDQGMTLLNRAIANLLNDRQWFALTNAGLCELGLGQKQRAKAYFKQALLVNMSYAPALLEMQKLSYQTGEFWPAKAYLQRYLSVAEHTSESLWYGMQTERALGNAGLAKEYQNLLLEKFPLSEQAKNLNSP